MHKHTHIAGGMVGRQGEILGEINLPRFLQSIEQINADALAHGKQNMQHTGYMQHMLSSLTVGFGVDTKEVCCRSATRCNTLQHAATAWTHKWCIVSLPFATTWRNTLQLSCSPILPSGSKEIYCLSATHSNTLQRTATHCNTLQHTRILMLSNLALWFGLDTKEVYCLSAAPCNTLQHSAAHCNILQHTWRHCNTL